MALKVANTQEIEVMDIDQLDEVENDMRKEAKILKQFNHPSIVKCMTLQNDGYARNEYMAVDHKLVYSVLKMGKNGTLQDLLDAHIWLPESVARAFFTQLIEGLIYINKQGHAHRDIKLENLYIGDDYGLVIAGFDDALLLHKSGKILNDCHRGTSEYNPPEVCLGSPYMGQAVEVFMVGVVLFNMLFGVKPFKRASRSDPYFELIANKTPDAFWKLQAEDNDVEPSTSAKELIWALLNIDPLKRPELGNVMDHAWMREPEASTTEIKKLVHKK